MLSQRGGDIIHESQNPQEWVGLLDIISGNVLLEIGNIKKEGAKSLSQAVLANLLVWEVPSELSCEPMNTGAKA